MKNLQGIRVNVSLVCYPRGPGLNEESNLQNWCLNRVWGTAYYG